MQPRPVLCALASVWATTVSAPVWSQPEAIQENPQATDIHVYVSEASQRFGLPAHWIYAVMRVESASKTHAVSPAGALGLMQLMPGTWARQRARLGLGKDPFDPRDNILAGAAYLREMYDNYGSPGFLAAYNAGPGRYQEWRDKGRPLPAETRAYVARIAPSLHAGTRSVDGSPATGMQQAITSWTHSALFPSRPYPPIGSRIGRDGESENERGIAAPESADPVFAPVTRGKPQ